MGKRPRIIQVNDGMQQGYRYELVGRTGRDLDPELRRNDPERDVVTWRVRRQA